MIRIDPIHLPSAFIKVEIDVHGRLDPRVEDLRRTIQIGIGEDQVAPVWFVSSTISTTRPVSRPEVILPRTPTRRSRIFTQAARGC
jgi:hypothetical protein